MEQFQEIVEWCLRDEECRNIFKYLKNHLSNGIIKFPKKGNEGRKYYRFLGKIKSLVRKIDGIEINEEKNKTTIVIVDENTAKRTIKEIESQLVALLL